MSFTSPDGSKQRVTPSPLCTPPPCLGDGDQCQDTKAAGRPLARCPPHVPSLSARPLPLVLHLRHSSLPATWLHSPPSPSVRYHAVCGHAMVGKACCIRARVLGLSRGRAGKRRDSGVWSIAVAGNRARRRHVARGRACCGLRCVPQKVRR